MSPSSSSRSPAKARVKRNAAPSNAAEKASTAAPEKQSAGAAPKSAGTKAASKAQLNKGQTEAEARRQAAANGSPVQRLVAAARYWWEVRAFRRPELLVLVLLALITRMVGVTSPQAVVFDEVYFKTAAGDYRTHKFFFDPHPPLSKMLLSLFSWLTGQNANTVASDKVPDTVVRYLPAFAGAMLVPIIWVIIRQLKGSRRVAALGATAVLLDNALIVESRFVLTDSMLLAFGMGAVAAYLAARTRTGWRFWAFAVLAAVLGAASVTTKWTGATALFLIGLIWLWDTGSLWINKGFARNWVTPVIVAAIFIILPPLIYFGSFAIHFALLSHTGSGDGYMSARFQRTLIGSPTYDPNYHMTFWGKFWDTYHAETLYEKEVTKLGHPYGSRWNQWPLENRSIYYWAGSTAKDGSQGNIYLIGNPAVWWGAVVGMIAVLSNMIFQLRRFAGYIFALVITGIAYLANWLPFERIERVMFLYHYMFALLYSIIIVSLGLGVLMKWNDESDEHFWQRWDTRRDWLYVSIGVVLLVGFGFLAPLTYGWSLSPNGLMDRMLLNKWR